MNDFKVVDLLYKGDVSDIWQGIHVASNTEVHVVTVNKKVNGHIFDQKRMVDLEPLVSQLNHPHMLKYHKIVQNENTIGIIMEHPKGGCLRDFLLRRPDKKLSENEARGFFKQIVSAVEYINQFDVVYRNLNLRNIFIDKNNQIKIGDFLICTKVGPIYKPSSATSSYHFYAPEIWLEDGKKIDAAADVWSLGVLLYVMTCGCYPFDGKHEFDIFLSVKRGQFAIPSSLSDECASLIKIILHPEASKRPTISQLKSHPWFMGVTIPTAPPKRIPSTSALRSGGLGGIPECEEDQPNSPAMPLLTPFQNLKIESASPMHSNTRSPQQTQQSMGFSESFGDPFMSYQTPIDAPRRRAKRPSADEDVQKVIASYFQLKQEDNKQSVSNLMANAFPLGHSNSFGNSFDVTPMNPTKMRRSSDSVLHNEEVMRLLGIGEQVNPFAPGSSESIPQQSGRPGRSNSSGGNGDRKKVIAASPSVKRPSSSSSRPKRRNSMDFSNRSSAHSIQDFSNIILPQAPSDRNDGPSSISINNQLQKSHFEHMQNFDNQMMSQYQQQQAQQARDMEYQKETQALLSGLPSSNDRNSVSLQDHPFLDPEVERAIGNLHADMDSLEFSLLDAGSNVHLEEWINSVAKFQGAD